MSIGRSTRQILAFRSGDACALCKCPLSGEINGESPANIGEIAHIAGKNPGSARYNPNMTEGERDKIENLIYLCRNCHGKIDASALEGTYSSARLREIKNEHEREIRDAIRKAFANIGFPELKKVTEWVLSVPSSKEDIKFSLTPIRDKMKKNDLGEASSLIIGMGLGVAQQIRNFIESTAQLDPDFPERLKIGFLENYYSLREEGLRGDELFERMCRFAEQGFKETSEKVASYAVMVHLFERCDLFEK